jgi:hypothetical protein
VSHAGPSFRVLAGSCCTPAAVAQPSGTTKLVSPVPMTVPFSRTTIRYW